jgi:hypothetical protein
MAGFVLGPGEGPAREFHGSMVVIKASGPDTLGQLGVMEFSYPPGLRVHPHVHDGEDEIGGPVCPARQASHRAIEGWALSTSPAA